MRLLIALFALWMWRWLELREQVGQHLISLGAFLIETAGLDPVPGSPGWEQRQREDLVDEVRNGA